MKEILSKIDWLVNLIGEYILVLTGAAVCLLIVGNAFMRYVLKMDFFGAEEITMFVAFWLYFVGSAMAAREDSHINANMMSLFTHNETALKTIELVKCALSLAMCCVVTVWCYNYVTWSAEMNARSNIFKIPNLVAQLPILISFVLWSIYLVRDLIKAVTAFRKAGA